MIKIAWPFGKRTESSTTVEIEVEPPVEPVCIQPQVEYTGEEEWEWEARRSYMKVMHGVDIGDWPYENKEKTTSPDH